MTARTGDRYVAEVVDQNIGKPAAQRVAFTLGQARDVYTQIERLTELVVTAAALHAGRIRDKDAAALAADELMDAAADLATRDPHLKTLFQDGE